MTSDETTEETAVEQTDTEQAPVLSGVRVPNVRPGAVSGLDHVLLDPDAAAAAETEDGTGDDQGDDAPGVDAELERIRGIEDDEERRDAADALWKHQTKDDPGADHSELAEKVRVAVYGELESAEEIANSVPPGTPLTSDEDGNLRTPDGDLYDGPVMESAEGTEPLITTPVGEVVESETAGTGDAVNADTGEVTPGGESLPPVEQEDGDPLEPVDDALEGDKNDGQDNSDGPETPPTA